MASEGGVRGESDQVLRTPLQNSITSGVLTILAAIAILASPSVLAARQAGTSVNGDTYVRVGAAGLIHRVSRVRGGSSSGVVELGTPDAADGVVRKRLSPDRTSEDVEVYLADGRISNAILELTDAFIDGRRITMDVIFTAQGSTTEIGRWRLTDAQVLSVKARPASFVKPAFAFAVTMRARSFLGVPTEGRAIVAADALWSASSVRLSLDGVSLPWSAVDSLELRGSWIKGEAGTGFTHPDLRVSTSARASSGDSLAAWYDRETAVGRSAGQQERSLSVEFLSAVGLAPAPLRLEARGVGMVAMRSGLNTGREDGRLEAELYVEEWDRAGRVPHPAAPPKGSSGSAPAEGASTGSPPLEAASGSFRVRLPSVAFTGVGSTCAAVGDASTLMMQLFGDDGSVLIAGRGPKLRVGTFNVALEGDNTILMAISQTGGTTYAAKRGTLTITEAGPQTSGTFLVFADQFDASGEVKEISISGAFRDLPKKC